jgi:hypothetical protein
MLERKCNLPIGLMAMQIQNSYANTNSYFNVNISKVRNGKDNKNPKILLNNTYNRLFSKTNTINSMEFNNRMLQKHKYMMLNLNKWTRIIVYGIKLKDDYHF